MTEQSTFQALDEEDGDVLGPPAALLVGFEREQANRFEQLLRQLGHEHRVVGCTTTMGELAVREALAGGDGGTLLPVGRVPQVILLSGLGDRQVGEILDRFGSTDLPRPIFAVATESNLERTVIQLLGDLVAEREALEG